MKSANAREALAEKDLVIVVLDLKVVLAYKEALGPEGFDGHLRGA
jgi:hypothetical protein